MKQDQLSNCQMGSLKYSGLVQKCRIIWTRRSRASPFELRLYSGSKI